MIGKGLRKTAAICLSAVCLTAALPSAASAGIRPDGTKVEIYDFLSDDWDDSIRSAAVYVRKTYPEKLASVRKVSSDGSVLNSPRQWSAHQGFSMVYPGNTALAFAFAGECGAYAIEGDVQMTKDKQLYMSHGSCVAGLGEGNTRFKDVDSKTIDKLKPFSTYGPKKISVGYCKAETFLGICKWYGCKAVVEIKKEDYTDEEFKDIARELIHLAEDVVHYRNGTIVTSSYPKALKKFRQVERNSLIRVAANKYRSNPEVDWPKNYPITNTGMDRESVWKWFKEMGNKINETKHKDCPDEFLDVVFNIKKHT